MSELTAFITRRYGLGASCFTLAVVGIKVTAISEHEDQCCVMMQLKEGETEVGGEGGGLPVLTPEQLATIATTSSTAPSGSSSSSDSNDSDSTMSLWLQWGALLQATFVAYANEASAGISKGAKVRLKKICIYSNDSLAIYIFTLMSSPPISRWWAAFPWWPPRA